MAASAHGPVLPVIAPALYRFGAVGLNSDVALHGFEHRLADPAGCDFTVRVRRAGPAPGGADGVLVLRALVRDRPLQVHRRPDGDYTVTHEGVAASTVAAGGSAIRWHLGDSQPTVGDVEFLVTTVLPRAITRTGTLVLHAASVLAPGGALLVTGTSGAGKSTAVTALHQATGWPLLGDDAAILGLDGGVPTVRSLGGDVRLWVDANGLLGIGAGAGTPLPRSAGAGTKARHAIQATAATGSAAAPVRLVARLVPGRAPAVVPARPAERVTLTRHQLMRLDRSDRRRQVAEFAFLVQWARLVPAVELHHARDGRAGLRGTVDRLVELATAGHDASPP